jgi:hypothetical protein
MTTLAAAAIARVVQRGYSLDYAEVMVDGVIDALKDPDREMLDAGLAELNLAMGPKPDPKHGDAYRRELARVIWAAMLDRVR